jgi:hypothetical protein
MSTEPAYILGKSSAKDKPLGRFLPPLPHGSATKWLDSNSLKGKIILDPFGAAPDLVREAAQYGARVIVAANNPIARLLIELASSPPTIEETQGVLSALASSRIREDRLEPHISALYITSCPNCSVNIQAKAYLWEQNSTSPHGRIIDCPHCKTAGEFQITEADLLRAAKFKPGGLHRARALERIAPLNDPDRAHVEEALNVYPPRAVYVLLTLINKLDTLNLDSEQERTLAGLLLSAFDRSNTLWSYPTARERPKQLTIPPVYREHNIWLVLENAANDWADEKGGVSLSYWPELPSSAGGICVFEGRIKDLAEQLTDIDITAVLTAFPRPNQAFWSLSALWAGWLWGQDAVDHFKRVLRRRRYDWAWHTTATHYALENLVNPIGKEVAYLGFIGETEPGYIAAVTIAASLAGMDFKGIALNLEEKVTQIHWQGTKPDEMKVEIDITVTDRISRAAEDYLLARGEPCNYLQLHTAILDHLGQHNLYPKAATPAESYSQLQQSIQTTLSDPDKFSRFGGSDKSLEVGQWWLPNPVNAAIPLSDRVEIKVVRYLIHNPDCTTDEVATAIYGEFPGTMTPKNTLIYECLQSYGVEHQGSWTLQEQDIPGKRRSELVQMGHLISELGQNLGFHVQKLETDSPQFLWVDRNGTPKYSFFVSASGLLGKFLLSQELSPSRGVIVLPGGRANLVMFKLREDARLKQISDKNWLFLKYRQARQLANNPAFPADRLEMQLGLDPLTYSETQLRMF